MSDKAKKKGKSSKKRGGMGAKGVFFLVILCITGVIFMPTSILLIVGMLPSLVALFVSGTGRGSRASTVAAMNIARTLENEVTERESDLTQVKTSL